MRSIRHLTLMIMGFGAILVSQQAYADTAMLPGAMLPSGPIATMQPLAMRPPRGVMMPIPGSQPRLPSMPMLAGGADPSLLCRRAAIQAGHAAGIPEHLMSAIARVETGRRDTGGQVNPWPWSINSEGTDHVFDTREQAIAAVRSLQASGVKSIDVGCMQVNLLNHPHAFASLEQAFDPMTNATYAAHFLVELHAQSGSWQQATADYHSATPNLGGPYQQKVASVLGEESNKDNNKLAGQPLPPTRFASATPTMTPSQPITATPMISTGARMFSNHSETAHIIPMANPSAGRGLDAYRMQPVRVPIASAPAASLPAASTPNT